MSFRTTAVSIATCFILVIFASPGTAQYADALKKAAGDALGASPEEAQAGSESAADEKPAAQAADAAVDTTAQAAPEATPPPVSSGGSLTVKMQNAAGVGAGAAAQKAMGGADLGSAAQHGGVKALDSVMQGTTGAAAAPEAPATPE